MRAAYITAYGGNEVLEVKTDAPKPTLPPKHILVEVHSASINPFDVKLKAGFMKDFIPVKLPIIAGGDFAGVVTEIGDEVSGFSVGNQVYGQAMAISGGSGSFADFVSSNADNAALKPVSVSFNDAAALVLVGASAVQALDDHIDLKKDQKILIHGGAGGIGHIAVQVAKAKGAYVATTVGPGDIAFVKALGADLVIDYKKEKFEEIVKDYDAVFDTVSGEVAVKSYQVLKKGGTLVSMLGPIDETKASQYDVKAITQSTQTNTQHLTKLSEYVDSGKVKIHIEKVFLLSDVINAYNAQDAHPKGKIVLEVKK